MTVNTVGRIVDYVSNGVGTGPFAIPFRFLTDEEISAIAVHPTTGVETALELGADYTLDGADDDDGGALTLTTAIASGLTLRIQGAATRYQPMAYEPNDRFPASSHERALDRQAIISQELAAWINDLKGRTILTPIGVAAPRGTPQEVLDWLEDELRDRLGQEFKGDPGGDATDIGAFTQAHTMTIAPGVRQFRTSCFDIPVPPLAGTGGARFIEDPAVDQDYYDAAPYGSCVIDAAGRGFRMNETVPHISMFGARDAEGQIKSTETLFDNSEALDRLWAWWFMNEGRVVADWSGSIAWGITKQHLMDNGSGTNAWWNRAIYRFIPGRLVAMVPIHDDGEGMAKGHMVHAKGRNFQNVGGPWELWPGTDTQVNAGILNANATGGLYFTGCGGSNFGLIVGQGFPRFLLQPDKVNSTANNNIPVSADVLAVQCGTISDKLWDAVPEAGHGIHGNYTEGVREGGNGSHNQTFKFKFHTTYGRFLQIGDPMRFNGVEGSLAIIQEIVELTSSYVVLRVSYWQADDDLVASGTVVFMQGGAVSLWGDKLAGGMFGKVLAYNCATGVQVHALFAPGVQTLTAELCQVGIQLGGIVQSAIHGFKVACARHLETCLITVLDADSAMNDCDIGINSTTLPDADGILGRMYRLNTGYKDEEGNFTGFNTKGFQGLRVSYMGGVLDAGAGGVISIGGDTEPFLSNAPPRQYHGPKNVSLYGDTEEEQEFDCVLSFDPSVARLFNHERTCEIDWIYSNEGVNGAPLGPINFKIDPLRPGDTILGGATWTFAPQTGGAVKFKFIGEPVDFSDYATICDWRPVVTIGIMPS